MKLANFGKDSEMFSLSLIYFIYDAVNLSIKGFFGQANIKAILDLFADHIPSAPPFYLMVYISKVKNEFLKI